MNRAVVCSVTCLNIVLRRDILKDTAGSPYNTNVEKRKPDVLGTLYGQFIDGVP